MSNKIAIASLVFSILTFVFLIFGGITCGLYYNDVFPGITNTLNNNASGIDNLSTNLMGVNCDTQNTSDGKVTYNCQKKACRDYYSMKNVRPPYKYVCAPGTGNVM